MSFRKISHAVFLIAIGTVIARVFGLFREIFTANFFGTTFIYDAFLLAFMIPNFFRGIVAEGALSTAFIPVFTDYIQDKSEKNESRKIVNLCFTLSLIFTVTLCIIVFGLSFFAAKVFPSSSKWFHVFYLLKFTFPYLIFISLAALNMGILNSHKQFLIPSLSPVVLDILWVAAIFFICPLFGKSLERQILGLCAGVVAGGLGQFLFQLPAVKRRGFFYKLDFDFNHPAVRKMGKLLAPVIIGVAVVPINLLVDYSLANTLSPGMVSGLWYATRIFQLPLGVFAISISTAILPWFSENISLGKYDEFRKNLYSSLRLLFFLLLPFTFGLIIFKTEVVSFLFKRGLFDVNSVNLTSLPLAFYSIGLLGYGGASVITRAFYAVKDTGTPVKIGIFSIAVNFLLDIVLMKSLKHSGIALSTSIVGLTNFSLLLFFFRRKHISLNLQKVFAPLLKIFISALLMGLSLYIFKIKMSHMLSLSSFLFTGIIGGTIIYVIFIKILKTFT